MDIETTFTREEILGTINFVCDEMTDQISRNNEFAAAIMNSDVDEAARLLYKTRKLIQANKMLLDFGCHIIGEEF